MKKLIVGLCMMLFVLAGCGSSGNIPDGMNAETYNIGVQAVDTLESYNDGNMSNDEAYERLSGYYDAITALEFNDVTSIEYQLNSNVQVEISAAQVQVVAHETAIDQERELKELLELK